VIRLSALARSILLSALFCLPVHAGEFSALTGPNVTVTPVSPLVIARDKTGKVDLHFQVGNGFHINSNQPKSDLLVPTALTLEPPSDMLIAKPSYPPGQDYKVEWQTEGPLSVYAGSFDVTAQIIPSKAISPGTYRVHGILRYQACDNRQCYPPKRMPVEFDVKVVRAASTRTSHNPGQSPHVHQ
jgi:hypothetical protein